MTTKPRTVHDYRPQHDRDCEIRRCANCGDWKDNPTAHNYGDRCDDWQPRHCTCGLAALLEAVPRLEDQENKEDHARSDQPQLRACESDPRGDDRDVEDDPKFTFGPWESFYKPKYNEWHVSLPCEDSAMRVALCPDGVPGSDPEECEAGVGSY